MIVFGIAVVNSAAQSASVLDKAMAMETDPINVLIKNQTTNRWYNVEIATWYTFDPIVNPDLNELGMRWDAGNQVLRANVPAFHQVGEAGYRTTSFVRQEYALAQSQPVLIHSAVQNGNYFVAYESMVTLSGTDLIFDIEAVQVLKLKYNPFANARGRQILYSYWPTNWRVAVLNY